MTSINAIPGLRARAEKRLKAIRLEDAGFLADPTKLLHELQVHQIELEMQNEALSETLAHCDLLQTKYRNLYDHAPVGYLTLSTMGAVLEGNLTAASMLGHSHDRLPNRRFQEFFSAESLPDVARFLSQLEQSGGDVFAPSLLLYKARALPRYVNAQGRSYTDPSSGVKRIGVVLMDVTALKVATDDVVNVISKFGDLEPQ